MAPRRAATLCAVVLLTATGVLSQTVAPPSFSVRPSDTMAARGHDAVLYCSVANLGRHRVFWNIDQRTTASSNSAGGREFTIGPNANAHSSYPRFQFQGDAGVGEFNLRVSDVREEDAGRYTCLVSDRNDPTSAATEAGAALTVLDSPVPPMPGYPLCRWTPDRHPAGFYDEGEVLTLTCLSRGGVPLPNLSWVRVRDDNSTEALPFRFFGSGDVVTAEAKVDLSSVDHESFYRCVEAHPSGAAGRACALPPSESGPQSTLDVRFKPSVRINPDAVGVELLETVTVELRCEAHANPPLTGSPVIVLPRNKTGEPVVRADPAEAAVRVELTSEDVGRDFYCRAVNEIGVGEARVDVRLLGALPTWLVLVVAGSVASVLFLFAAVIACACCVDRSKQEDERYKDRPRYSVNRSRQASRRRHQDEGDGDFIDGSIDEDIVRIDDFQGGQELADLQGHHHKGSSAGNDFETGERGPRYQNVNEAFQSDSCSYSQSNPSSSEPIIDSNSE